MFLPLLGVSGGADNRQMIFYHATLGSPADGATVYSASFSGASGTSTNRQKIICQITGDIVQFWVAVGVGGTLGSSENVVMDLQVDGVDSGLTITTQFDSADKAPIFTTGRVAVTAGQLLGIESACPTWTTNPTNSQFDWGVRIIPT